MALGLSPSEIIKKGTYPLLNIHQDWERIPLSKVADVLNGFAFDSAEFNNSSTGMPLIRIRDVGKGNIETYYSGSWTTQYLIQKDDILIGMDGDFRCAKWHGEKALLNQRVCKVTLKNKSYDRDFLFYILQPYLDAINAETSSVTVKHLSSKTIQQIPLPNPPLPVQQAIVARIEGLFSELDAGTQELKTALTRLKTYRRAVLHSTFSNQDWAKTKLGEVVECLDNRRKPVSSKIRQEANGDVPYYGANGQTGWINDYIFNEDLILVVEDETFTGREKPFSYKITGKSWVNNHAHILKPKDDKCLDINFLNYSLWYYPFLPLTTGTTGRKKLTKAALLNAPYLIPDLETQAKIVAEIEARLSEADALEATIRQELARAENLRQSILKKAFAGQLVSHAAAPPAALAPAAPEQADQVRPATTFGDQMALF